MIFRPVMPQSPRGPPTTKRPVVLIKNWVFLVSRVGRNDFFNYDFDNPFPDFFIGDVRGVLGGDHHGGDGNRFSILDSPR